MLHLGCVRCWPYFYMERIHLFNSICLELVLCDCKMKTDNVTSNFVCYIILLRTTALKLKLKLHALSPHFGLSSYSRHKSDKWTKSVFEILSWWPFHQAWSCLVMAATLITLVELTAFIVGNKQLLGYKFVLVSHYSMMPLSLCFL
jgi:hypothetical protein